MKSKQILGLGAIVVLGYLALPKLLGSTPTDTRKSAEMVSTNATPGTFSPTSASEVVNAYLEVPLANDVLMEEYAMQGRGLGNYAKQSLLGDKYVAAMNANGMLGQYTAIYGGA